METSGNHALFSGKRDASRDAKNDTRVLRKDHLRDQQWLNKRCENRYGGPQISLANALD
jgi:hypothetical protein